MSILKIGICQLESTLPDKDFDPRPDNLARALSAIDELADQGAELLVFGEIYLNGYVSEQYTPRYAVAEDADDPFVAPLVDVAARRDLTILMGATTHKGNFPGDVYNSVLVITPSGLAGVYSKSHVAAFAFGENGEGRAGEKLWWSPGQSLEVFPTPVGRIGVEICYDIWFPEVARTLTLKGADLIVNVSAAVCGFEENWDHMLFARSAENCVPYLHVSVVGVQGEFGLFGGSRLFAPTGSCCTRRLATRSPCRSSSSTPIRSAPFERRCTPRQPQPTPVRRDRQADPRCAARSDGHRRLSGGRRGSTTPDTKARRPCPRPSASTSTESAPSKSDPAMGTCRVG